MRAVRPEEVPAEDDAHVALPADERVEEHLSVRLLVLSRVSLEWMPEDVHEVRVPELDAESEQSDRSREVECESDQPWKPERANCTKVSLFDWRIQQSSSRDLSGRLPETRKETKGLF